MKRKAKHFIVSLVRLTVVAVLGFLVLFCSLSVSESFNYCHCRDPKKNNSLNRKMLQTAKFNTSYGHVPHTNQPLGAMLHGVPSTPNPIQNKYPHYRHH